MTLKNGNLVKKKWDFVRENLKTKEGLVDIFIGGALWGIIIIETNQQVFQFSLDTFEFVGNEIVQRYLAYLAFSIYDLILGMAITFVIITVMQKVRRK